MPAAALLTLPCIAVWLFAERLGLMEGRQLAALATVWVLVFAVLGPRVFWAFAVPLGYLVFLVPFGAFLVPALQGVTARFIDAGLGVLAIPHTVDQTSIEIPEGQFLVAEACAGLRFLIASIAFGALYAVTVYRSPGRRIAFIAVSIVVPILANGIRALGIVLLGHLKGSAAAGAVDHILYGWLFFSAVLLLLVILGLPFRQDTAARVDHAPRLSRRAAGRDVLAAAGLTLALAFVGPSVAWGLSRRAWTEAIPSPIPLTRLVLPAGCRSMPAVPERHFDCGGAEVRVIVETRGPHADAGMIIADLRAYAPVAPVIDGDAEDVHHATFADGNGLWRLDSTEQPEAATAAAVWLGGRFSPGDLKDRAALGWASLAGSSEPRFVVCVAVTGRGADGVARAVAAQLTDAMEDPH